MESAIFCIVLIVNCFRYHFPPKRRRRRFPPKSGAPFAPKLPTIEKNTVPINDERRKKE
jgi:hypothetical protein